jgi:NAD(P)-dependent dehydrogenase (short-subunit alcohol dehydrogenase family)
VGEFEGKVALVTGGNSGLGKSTAEAFAREGAKVVLAARREELGREVEASIRAAGGEATFVRCDVTHEEEVKALVERTLAVYGRLDYAYNNAWAPTRRTAIVDMTVDAFEHDIAFLRATLWCMKYEIPAIASGGGGAIVNCSTTATQSIFAGLGSYAATKSGVETLTRTAAYENAAKNIRINSVCAGGFETPMAADFAKQLSTEEMNTTFVKFAFKRLGRPPELAQAVLFLCSERASFITGINLLVDGGYCLT